MDTANELNVQQNNELTSQPVQDDDNNRSAKNQASFADRVTQRAFLRNVFLILTTQLVLSALIVAPLLLIESWRRMVIEDRLVFILAIIIFWFAYALIVCAFGLSTTWPINLIILTSLTASLALIIGCICALANFQDILIGIVLTAVLCFILGSLSSISYFLVTIVDGMLSTILFTSLVLIFLYILVPSKILTWLILSFGMIVIMMYFIIDLEIIMRGKHRYNVAPQDYVAAATLLYVDIVFIFAYLVMMLLRR